MVDSWFDKEKRDTVKLLRIPFSYFLMPVFLFAWSQAKEINYVNAVIAFLVLHLFIYPASNGYNSYMDRDETPIGGLEHPPQPTRLLFYVSIALDVTGLILALTISTMFFLGVLAYMTASRAYSFKGIRLKRFPFIGFFTVVFFQGGFTFWMSSVAVSNGLFSFSYTTAMVMSACSLLIAGVYPLTQVYQHEADKKNGDHTISYLLGIKGTFIFTAFVFSASGIAMYGYFEGMNRLNQFLIFQLFLVPVIIYFIWWFIRVLKTPSEASFKNTMRMNFIASTCMNGCFLTLLLLRLI